MPNFIARVELHSASYVDYENLHIYMQQRGYARTIKGSDGKTYQLPTGTYVSSSFFASASAALDAAVAAAKATGRASSAIVADWSTATWEGLATVNSARMA